MERYPAKLQVELIDRKTWKLMTPFSYISVNHGIIRVPADFVTDFASVPRWPLTYLLLGSYGHMAAVIHDYLYSTKKFSRKDADEIFKAALRSSGQSRWRTWLMYAGVRIGGSKRYAKA